MARKTIRDININKRSTLSKKSVTSQSVTKKKTTANKKKVATTRQATGYTHSYKEHNRNSSRAWLWMVLVIVVGGLIAWTVMGGARIEITPEYAQIDGKVEITAYKEASGDDFEYEVITITENMAQKVAAGKAEFIEEKAQGTIVIFNEESSSQRLIEETRFETPDGLIYKLAKGKAVTVPAASGGTPGSLEVTVYADEPGEKYNIDLTDFVIPGWREVGSDKFNTQYARSKTVMAGGFSGTKRTVGEEQKIRAQEEMHAHVTSRLHKEAPAQIPESFVFFDALSTVTFATLPSVDSPTAEEVTLNEQGNLYGVLFERKALSKLLAEKVIEGYAGEPILVTNFDELLVTAIEPVSLSESDTSITFSIEGTFEFEWQIETDVIQGAMAGVAKKNFDTAMSAFVGIKKAELTMYPLWLAKIPEKVKIEVLEVE
jgi:vacuolar-type H+-ATPase subunit F/Vma7